MDRQWTYKWTRLDLLRMVCSDTVDIDCAGTYRPQKTNKQTNINKTKNQQQQQQNILIMKAELEPHYSRLKELKHQQ